MEKAGITKLMNENRSLKSRVKKMECLLADMNAAGDFPDQTYIHNALFHLSPTVIFEASLEKVTVYDVSDVLCRVTGYSKEEVIGKTPYELGLLMDHDRENVRMLLLRDRRYQNLEMRHRRKDGTLFTSIDSGELLKISDKHYVVGISIDITARLEAKEALEMERDLSDTIINSLPGLFYVIDENYKFIRWNKNLINITGYNEEDIRNMTVLDLYQESERKYIAERIREVFHGGEFSNESNVVLKDGAVKTFFFSSKWLMYKDTPCVVGNAFDITVRKRALEELRRSAMDLEEANTALRVFMKNHGKDQEIMEEKIQMNVNDLVIPYLKKLGQVNLDERYKKYLNILENNLSDILSPFMTDLLAKHRSLTPQEIQIADLISKGRNTKEIAEILNASVNTIATHRNNLRKKLDLRNSKINLRSYFRSLK